jgi:hypothetical protein
MINLILVLEFNQKEIFINSIFLNFFEMTYCVVKLNAFYTITLMSVEIKLNCFEKYPNKVTLK